MADGMLAVDSGCRRHQPVPDDDDDGGGGDDDDDIICTEVRQSSTNSIHPLRLYHHHIRNIHL